MAKRVLITGCSGYLGSLLVPRLLRHPLVARVVGVDLRPPARARAHPKSRFVLADIRDQYTLRSVLEEEGIDVVFHLAFLDASRPDDVRARETNVNGTLVVLEAAHKCPRVQKLIIAGSTAAYGACRGNPRPLPESHPLRASGWAFAEHKRRVEEELAKALPQIRRSLQVSVLRLCTVAGPSQRAGGPISRLRALPFAASVLGRPGGLQFLSEADAQEAFCRAMEAPELRGPFNAVPDDGVSLAEVCRSLGKRRVPLPYSALWLGLLLGRRFFGSSIPEGVTGYLAYPVVASNRKLQETAGFRCAQGSLEALRGCVDGLKATPTARTSPS